MADNDFAADPARGCAPGKVDPEDYFSDSRIAIATAKKACRGCPFRDECLRRAVTQREFAGIWGGVNMASTSERKKAHDQQIQGEITDLWQRGLSDGDIGLRLDRSPGDIQKIRARLGLPAIYGPGGRRRNEVAA